jgi:two-component system NtrC family response regulator
MRKRLLIVEDENNLARVITTEAKGAGWDVSHAGTGEEGLVWLEERFDVILLDLNLPGMSGMDVYRSIITDDNVPEVVILTGNADVGVAVDAMKLGAYDYLQKPVPMERLFLVLEKAFEKSRLRFENLLFHKKAEREEADSQDLVLDDPSVRRAFNMADKVAGSDSSVIILGETGTGKDVMANYIHRNSSRSSGPLISINCASFQESMLENELFGHEKGAFTDARERKLGFFEIASGGTLFLDEISEMPLGMQAKLLHVLEKNEFYRVGGTKIIRSNARVLAATNRDLQKRVEKGAFRQDLYYRINMFSITIPPLKERPLDIIPLGENFLSKLNTKRTLTDESKILLTGYHWPGNVRELKHVIERAALVAPNESIEPEHLMIEPSPKGKIIPESTPSMDENVSLEDVEAGHIVRVLRSTDWKRSEAAKVLGVDPKTLYRKIRKYGLERED